MKRRNVYIFVILIIVLSFMLLNAQSLANIIFTQKVILKPTPTTPEAAIFRLEQGDILKVKITPKTPTEELIFYIRAYSVKLNPGSEFNPILIRYIPIAGPEVLDKSYNYTIEAKRAGNYAVEVYNQGDNVYEVEVEFIPVKLDVWTNRIRFVVATPLAIITLFFVAKLFEKEDEEPVG